MARELGEMDAMVSSVLWPDLEAFTQYYQSEPPLTDAAQEAEQAVSLVEGLNPTTAEHISTILRTNSKLRWEIILGLQPAGHTTGDSLQILWEAQCIFEDRFCVMLITPKAIGGHWPRQNLSLVELQNGVWMAWIGSSPSLGLDVAMEPHINCWFNATRVRLEPKIMDYLGAMREIAVPLTEAALEIPLLYPAKGSAEAQAIWDDYENRLGLPQDAPPDQMIGEGDLNGGTEDTPRPCESIVRQTRRPVVMFPPRDDIAEQVTQVYEQLRKVNVGKAKPPPSAPLKPEWFGLRSFRDGLIKLRSQISIDLLGGEQQKQLEKRRKATSALVQLLGFGMADGVRLIPQTAIRLLDKALEASQEEANEELALILGQPDSGRSAQAVENFIKRQSRKIEHECAEVYRQLNGLDSSMPVDLPKKVIAELTKRAKALLEGNIAADYSTYQIHWDPRSQSNDTQLWIDAGRLFEEIYKAPRELLKDHYGLRKLSGTCVELASYLKHLNFLGWDPFFDMPALQTWSKTGYYPPSAVAQRAEEELQALQALKARALPPREHVAELLRLIR